MADRKLFVGNLVRRITQEDLWIMYSTFGPLEECAKFHESFGFVRFLHAEDARQALDATHGITLKGRCIKVEFAATTTSWRSAQNTCCTDCRPPVRYNIPPIRAVDMSNHRGHHHTIVNALASSTSTPPPIAPIGHRRKLQGKSTNSQPNCSTAKSSPAVTVTCSSPSSSYAASTSHTTENEDHDCDLDSGYNDESDTPFLSSSSHAAPPSPWYDLPVTDEMFIWDFQLFPELARTFPLIKTDSFSSESTDEETWGFLDCLGTIDLNQYF